MASLNQRRFHVVTLLFIVIFLISSSLGTSLSSKNLERKELKTTGANQTATPSSYPMENDNSTAAFTGTPSITVITPPILANTSDSTNSNATHTTSATSSPISDVSETAGSEAPLEAGEQVAWKTEDLLVPAPQSVYLLAQLMALSMSQIDTAFRGSSQRNQSVSIHYNKGFRTTMLQISQKLNNAFSLASANSETIDTSLLNAPEKVEEAVNYLKKFQTSSQNAKFLVLPLKSLKDTTDQNVDLSSQVASQLSGLVRLVDEVIETVDSLKTEKEQQRESVIVKLQSTQTDKNKIENEIIATEKEIEQLNRELRLRKIEIEIVDLKQLRFQANDESRCYWSFNQKEGLDLYVCPYRPESSKILEAENAREAHRKLFDSTMKQLAEKEKSARDRREKDNKLLIGMKKQFADKGQLAGDIQLLEKSRTLLTGLMGNFTMLERSWVAFVGICRDIQEGAAKSHALVMETIENPSSWNNTLSDELAAQLKDTRENLSQLKTIVHSYLQGYKQHIMEIVAEAEQMMTKRGHPQELERRLLRKCELASREIQNFIQSNSQLHEADSQIAQRVKIIK